MNSITDMTDIESVALVIPCKDEAKRLDVGSFLEALKAYPFLMLLFVDDGSSDVTAETLAYLERVSPAIRALYFRQNRGKAEAVRSGINWLLTNTNCQYVGFWDADLATPFSELQAFMETFRKDAGCTAVIGSRWPHLGVDVDRNVFRHCTGGVMKALIRLVLGTPVYDTQCGAKIFRRDAAQKLFREPFLSRWLFDVELFKRMRPETLVRTVKEVPLSFWRDVKGSKLRFADTFRVIPDLMRIWYNAWRRKDLQCVF